MIMEKHNIDKYDGKHEIRKNIETHNFIHPQALPHPPPPALGILLDIHVFMY